MVWIIKINIFHIFAQKSEKLHCGLWQLRTAIYYTAPFKIRARCLHQTGGFRGQAIERRPSNLLLTDPCCHGNHHRYLNTKLAITRLVWEIRRPFLAPNLEWRYGWRWRQISHSEKNKMAAAAILNIHINVHNSVAIAHIHTKFDPETKTDVPETGIPSNLTSVKIIHF